MSFPFWRIRGLLFIASLVLLPRLAIAQVEWKLAGYIPIDQGASLTILELARLAGVEHPVRVVETYDGIPVGCPVFRVESERLRTDHRRVWTTVTLRNQFPHPETSYCEDRGNAAFKRQGLWSVDAPPETRTEWIVEDGAWQHALRLSPNTSFTDAERIVLAFHREQVIDRRVPTPGSGAVLPTGSDASGISSLVRRSDGRGWEVLVSSGSYSGTIFTVDVQDDRVVVISDVSFIA